MEATLSLEITYFCDARNLNIAGLPILSETRTISASSAQSGATPASAVYVSIYTTADVRYAYGSNPTATATAGVNGHFLAAGERKDLPATAAWIVAGITAA